MESTQYFDKRFASKFCFALDTHFFHWMKQCKGSRDRESVNDQLQKFGTVLESVLIDKFHQIIPPIIRLVDEIKNYSTP